MPSRLQTAINLYKQQLKAREEHAAASLNYAHQQTLKIIDAKLEDLYQQLSDAQANLEEGDTLPLSWLYEANRLQNIEQYIRANIDHFGSLAQMTTTDLQHNGLQLGIQAGQALLQASVPGGVSFSFGMPAPAAIAHIVGATQAGSPLADLFSGFGAEVAQKAKMALISGLMLGNNPARDDMITGAKSVADGIKQALNISLYRAQTIARTEMLRSYRDANTETFKANSDVVDGWRWTCDLSSRTCAACLAMDGEVFSVDDTLDSHPNCRCTPVPITKSWDDILGAAGIDSTGIEDTNPASDMQTGSDWFDNQSEDVQQSILGKSGYQLYANGDVTLQDFVGKSSDATWGDSIYQKSVKELTK